MKKISAVIIQYKRDQERAEIIEHLKSIPFIDDIVIHDNKKENIKMYGRYHAMRFAKHDTVYVQDDDCLVQNIPELYKYYFDGVKAPKMVNNMKRERAPFYAGADTLVGWGAIFDRRWLGCLELYLDKYGMDEIFLRECDRIFTSLVRLAIPRLTIPAQVIDFPSATSAESLSLQAEHEQSRIIAVKRCEEIIHAYRE